MELSPVETRILGCLLEKERTTPENYPLSLNSLVAACNQTTNREPVLTLGEKEVEDALESLRYEKKLATVVFGGGSRVQKYRHNLAEIYNFNPREYALLCVLMLRGPQTAGELRARAERLAPFTSLAEVESTLEGLSNAEEPLARLLPVRPGQKERRYAQLFSGEPLETLDAGARSSFYPATEEVGQLTPRAGSLSDVSTRLEAAEGEIIELRTQLEGLRDELASFRKQFEYCDTNSHL